VSSRKVLLGDGIEAVFYDGNNRREIQHWMAVESLISHDQGGRGFVIAMGEGRHLPVNVGTWVAKIGKGTFMSLTATQAIAFGLPV
jgi:hypothetical protein